MQPTPQRTRWMILLVATIFLIGLLVRLYDVTDAPLEVHPTRQMRAALIARAF